MKHRWLAFILACALGASTSAAQPRPPADPILILVSFDGWRWDYTTKEPAPNLRAFAARGVRATELIPSFPSFTFPNHYTIVTGLYPGHHGIIANTIEDPGFPERFTMSAQTARDARWWGGEPIWVTAIRQGRRAAAMFWPGDEAPIDGVRPTYWRPFDTNVTSTERVQQVLDWLALPPEQRPSFIGLYLEEVDHAGHDFGPGSPELRTAVSHLDAGLQQLLDGIKRAGLADRTTTVVVSDHGMAAASEQRLIFLDDYIDLDSVDLIEAGEFLQIAPVSGTVDALYQSLRGKMPHLTVYRREEIPARYHYRDNPRIAPIVAVVDEGWILTSHRAEAKRKPDAKKRNGSHGYDPALASMHGLFAATGPAIREGVVVKPFQNIHVYDFMCRVLNLKPAPNDGDPAVTSGFFR
jgi:predicted AlkP superfamily pyrophosphatase or phosphodiesterase